MRTELEALLATLRGNDQEAEKLVRSLTNQERTDLRRALYRLDILNTRVRRELEPERFPDSIQRAAGGFPPPREEEGPQ